MVVALMGYSAPRYGRGAKPCRRSHSLHPRRLLCPPPPDENHGTMNKRSSKVRPGSFWRVISTAGTVGIVMAGCEQADAPIAGPVSAPSPAASRRYVTGEAAAALNSQGFFSFAAPTSPGARPIITAQRAGELALASVRTWGPSLHEAWVAERGRSFDLQTLGVDSRVLFAKTPYGRFPDGYHSAYARLYGPYYIVRLNSGSEPIMLVSVSAYATDVTVDGRGIVHRPVERGMEFVHQVLPATVQDWFVSAEGAVERVGRETGARVARTPELIRINKKHIPSSAVWKLSLDRDIDIEHSGRATPFRTRELYVATVRGAPLMVRVANAGKAESAHVLVRTGRELRSVPIEVPILEGETTIFSAAHEGGL